MRAKLLLAAALASSLSVASGYTTVTAKVQGLGADYFHDKVAEFKCRVVPIELGMMPFYAACTRAQANAFSDSTVTIQYEATPSGDLPPDIADRNARLAIQAPAVTILGGTIRSPGRARRTVEDGPRSTLIVLVNFDDMALDWATEESAHRMMNAPNGERDVNGMFNASTYGRVSFPANHVTVVTVNSPYPAPPGGCDRHDMARNADVLVAAQRSDLDLDLDFQHKVYFIPRQVPDCGDWDGAAQTGSGAGGSLPAWLRTDSASIFAHELGHHLGLSHAASDDDDDGAQDKDAEYGDDGAIMGDASSWVTLNAPHRVQLGYLGDGNGVATYNMTCAVPATAQVTLNISRLDLNPAASSTRPQVLRIARYPASTYFLSFKSGVDWDGTSAPDSVRNRLQIHTHDSATTNKSLLVKHLGEGEVFVGRANRNDSPVPLNVRVVSIGTDAITVTVNTGCVENFQGYTACDLNVSNAAEPGAEADIWHFTVPTPPTPVAVAGREVQPRINVTFDGCASSVNPAISVYNRLAVPAAGSTLDIADPIAQATAGCATTVLLDSGDYSVFLADNQGGYSMQMQCSYPPSAIFQGIMACGQTVSGDTNVPGIDVVNSGSVIYPLNEEGHVKDSWDHVWDFELDRPMKITLDACASSFDTQLSVLNRLELAGDGTVIPAELRLWDADGCANTTRSRITDKPLSAGRYSVLIEGYGHGERGRYSVAMTCADVATSPPTPLPTPRPTRRPTPPPTTANPTANPTPPPTPPPTSPPTSSPVPGVDDPCPDGFKSYPDRYNRGLGRIGITKTHYDCAARCLDYSGRQWSGGCRGFMSGMYSGMLFCKSYGVWPDANDTVPCAPFSGVSNPGINSGALGTIHPRTGQQNVGGRCCSNVYWRECGDPLARCDAATGGDGGVLMQLAGKSSSDSTGSVGTELILLAIVVPLGILVALCAASRGGGLRGANAPQRGAPTAPQPRADTRNLTFAARDDAESAADLDSKPQTDV